MRLTKITTHNGDDGFSHLADGTKILKNHQIFHALGDLDELNSFVGFLIANMQNFQNFQNLQNLQNNFLSDFLPELTQIQRNIFDFGGQIAMQDFAKFAKNNAEKITNLENLIAKIQQNLSPLREFILPSGHILASQCHLCRSIARRCERSLVDLLNEHNREIFIYINRLSDFFFVLSRWINKNFEQQELFWK